MVTRTRYIGSGRIREGGYSATHKQDFIAHVTGGDWRHVANHIDMSPLLSAPFTGTEVQTVLEQITTHFLGHVDGTMHRHTARHIDMDLPLVLYPAPDVQQTLELMAFGMGQGFVTIGDGYRAEDASPQRDLYEAFLWAFNHPRLKDKGGIIVVKSGDYILQHTVIVPKGFTIWGEAGGTRIDTKICPAFNFSRSENRELIGDGVTETNFSTKMSRMWNLTVFDNFGGSTPSPISPIILLQPGSEVLLENVTLVGKYTGTNVTPYAVATATWTGDTPNTAHTILQMKQCFIDAVGIGVSFLYSLRPDYAELKIENCKARTYSIEANQGFIKATLGKLFINNNYHIVVSPNSLYPGGFLNLSTTAETEGAFVSLIGNKGGPNIVSNLDAQYTAARERWIYDTRTTKWVYRLIDSGNQWGVVNSTPWQITVGDGIHSTGDFTGISALEIVNTLIDRTTDYSNSRSEQIIVINPGEYTVNSQLNIPKLLGNTTARDAASGRSIRILLNSNIPINSSGVYENYIGIATNVEFQSINNPQRISSKTTGAQEYTTFKNVSFINCTVYVEHDNKSIIEDCYFHQDGTFPNLVSLVVQNDETSIINCCEFTGYGYALMQSAFEGEIQLTNCLFDPYKNTVGTGSRILNYQSLYNNGYRYINIGNLTSKVLVDNIVVNCGVDGYTAIDSSLYNNVFRYVEIKSDDLLIVKNSKISGPDQLYRLTNPIAACTLIAEGSLSVINNTFIGALPLHITETLGNSSNSLGTMFQVIGNDIHHYLNSPIPVATAFVVDLPPAGGIRIDQATDFMYEGSDGYEGYAPFSTLNISNNRIIGYYNKVARPARTTWIPSLTKIGLFQLNAPGWSVKFDNNDVIYITDDSGLPVNVTIQAAIQIDNSSVDFTYANLHIHNNTITHSTAGNALTGEPFGFITENMAVLDIKTAVANISGNNILTNWHYVVDLSRSFLVLEPLKYGTLITGNGFHSNMVPSVLTPIYIMGLHGPGAIFGNWFDIASSGNIINGDITDWTVSAENYGLFDITP